MDVFFAILLALFVGFYIGWKLHRMFVVHIIKTDKRFFDKHYINEQDDLEKDDIEVTTDDGKTIKTKGVELKIELHQGLLYAFTKAEDRFIAQGETIEELLKIAHARFPGQTFFGDLPEKEHQSS